MESITRMIGNDYTVEIKTSPTRRGRIVTSAMRVGATRGPGATGPHRHPSPLVQALHALVAKGAARPAPEASPPLAPRAPSGQFLTRT